MIKIFCSCFLIIPLCISAEGWVVTVVDSSPGRSGRFVSIAIDSASQSHIGYHIGWAGSLRYARHDSSGWVTETVDTTGSMTYVSLALDKSGVPHIGYYHRDNGDLRYARGSSSGWFIDTIDTTGIVGKYVSIGVNSAGCPGVSYYDETSGDLKYAELDNDQWLVEQVDTTGDVGRYASFTFDEANDPHISYYDATNHCLKYARRDGVEWFVAVVDTPADTFERVGWHTSLALDSLGYPHISYHYRRETGIWENGLRYAKWDGLGWLVQLVEWGFGGDFWVGWGTSIALDSRDYPCIAYKRTAASDIPPYDLRYTEWNGAGWETETVDIFPNSEGDVSLSLDIADQPHIAYYTFQWDWGLKHATRPTSIEEDRALCLSGEVVLHQNYPNPFSKFTNIYFWMSEHSITDSSPKLEIYDASGRLVRSLQVQPYQRGLNLIRWDGRDGLGQKVADGVYFYRLKVGEANLTRKMVILH